MKLNFEYAYFLCDVYYKIRAIFWLTTVAIMIYHVICIILNDITRQIKAYRSLKLLVPIVSILTSGVPMQSFRLY